MLLGFLFSNFQILFYLCPNIPNWRSIKVELWAGPFPMPVGLLLSNHQFLFYLCPNIPNDLFPIEIDKSGTLGRPVINACLIIVVQLSIPILSMSKQ